MDVTRRQTVYARGGVFNPTSVFDLSGLAESYNNNGFIKTKGNRPRTTKYELESSSKAKSTLWSENASCSYKRGGLFRVSSSFSLALQKGKTTSDQNTWAQITTAQVGDSAKIIVAETIDDKTIDYIEADKYLIGNPLTQAQVDGNVSNIYDKNGTIIDIDVRTFKDASGKDASGPGFMQKSDAFYPNIQLLTKMEEMLSELITQNSAALTFLSNIPNVSNVSSEQATQYATAYQAYYAEAYSLIQLALSQGVDIDDEHYNQFQLQWFGTDPKSTLSDQCEPDKADQPGTINFCARMGGTGGGALPDVNFFRYSAKLMEAERDRVWRNAPSGYMPAYQNKDNPVFWQPQDVWNAYIDLKIRKICQKTALAARHRT